MVRSSSPQGSEEVGSQTSATASVAVSSQLNLTGTPYPLVQVSRTLTPLPGSTAPSPLIDTPPYPVPGETASSPPYPLIETPQAPLPPGTLEPSGSVSATQGISGTLTTGPTPFPTPTYLEFSLSFGSWCPPWNSLKSEAYASRVFDGLTVQVVMDGKSYLVRYIGLDAESAGPAAEEANRLFVEGKQVLLIKDYSERDSLGRLLRYVISDGKFINLELISDGLIGAAAQPPDIACAPRFEEAEQRAVDHALGIWAPEVTPGVSLTPTVLSGGPEVIIWGVRYSGTEENESDEYVEIRNIGAQPVDLGGWLLNAQKSGLGIFIQSFLLQPGASCRVYTNQVNPDSCAETTIGSPLPVWRDNGECALLKDSEGNQVFQFCY
jgi:endonuclease YncB( thermonuclease family)